MANTSCVDKITATLDDDKLVELARFCENSERYHDMSEMLVELVNRKALNNKILSYDERDLFSRAFKSIVSAKRTSWRILDG